MSLLKHKGLKAFIQFGFSAEDEAGNNVLGDCIWCGKSKKMYVNPEKKTWDCKSCGLSGGYKQLMKTAMSEFKYNKSKTIKLAKSKGLPSSILKAHDIKFNDNNDNFILPIYNVDGEGLWDLRMYNTRGKKFMSLSGCSVGLYGWEEIKYHKTVYVAEGEWDKFALELMLKESDKPGCVVSVPGSQTFKHEWATHFKNKSVILCYDNDDPGKIGANKVYKILKSIVKNLQVVNWKKKHKDGYDARDFYIDNKKNYIHRLEKLLKDKPPVKPKTKNDKDDEDQEDVIVYDGPYVPVEKVYETYNKWLYLKSNDPIDVMFGTIIANRLEGDPLWLFIVAPPGGTKTELINTISDAPAIHTTSNVTPPSLISGANTSGGGDPSLIPRLNNKILVVKDFTPVLTMPIMVRDEIFGIFRDAYDGKIEKEFGNGVQRRFISKFGFISAVTPAIDAYTEGNAALGERFLRYNIPHDTGAEASMALMDRVFNNAGKEVEMRTELSELGSAVLSHDFKKIPKVPAKIKKQLMGLAQYVARMRGTVIRDKWSGDATHHAFSEFGTRMVKQFNKFLWGVGMFKNLDTITNKEYKLACDMGRATIPAKIEEVVRYMYIESDGDYEETFSTRDLVSEMSMPRTTMERTLDNLKMLGLVEKDASSPGNALWNLSQDCIYLIDVSKVYA